MSNQPSHFEGKDALEHILEKRTATPSGFSEPHGSQMPTSLAAGTDTAKQLAFFLMLLYVMFYELGTPYALSLKILAFFSLGTLVFYTARSAWVGWSRLERLHRLLQQEKYEIEHHRNQERDELKALYKMKGFDGPLLEEVVDVLMADDEKLLKVMLEEEMGLSLEVYDHPLRQSVGAAIGGAIAIGISFLAFWLLPDYGVIFSSLTIMALAGIISAYREGNRMIPSAVWNVGIGALGLGVVFFPLQYLIGR
jgi:hypothetical protein